VPSFGYRDKEHQRLQAYCRACSNAYWREWYGVEANKSRQIKGVAIRRQRSIAENRRLINNLKKQPCTDCGVSYPPEVMDFDHIAAKTSDISRMIYTHGRPALEKETRNCEVVCANCHRKRTAQRRLNPSPND
jgi:5-methylcytosine-specific restriction endonuclease McrA